jgi:anti-anti-sigma regulatory factor
MLRITTVDTSSQNVRLRVEGRLTGRSVEELRQTCNAHLLGLDIRVVLDLADVSFADAEGIELLKNLRSRNVTLLNSSPFLAFQVGGHDGGGSLPAS